MNRQEIEALFERLGLPSPETVRPTLKQLSDEELSLVMQQYARWLNTTISEAGRRRRPVKVWVRKGDCNRNHVDAWIERPISASDTDISTPL